jgi:hypothetical protein
VTAPEDLILSIVALAENAELDPENTASNTRTALEIRAHVFNFISNPYCKYQQFKRVSIFIRLSCLNLGRWTQSKGLPV